MLNAWNSTGTCKERCPRSHVPYKGRNAEYHRGKERIKCNAADGTEGYGRLAADRAGRVVALARTSREGSRGARGGEHLGAPGRQNVSGQGQRHLARRRRRGELREDGSGTDP